jgi:hypothetical protein
LILQWSVLVVVVVDLTVVQVPADVVVQESRELWL